jgi:hypothetical protein
MKKYNIRYPNYLFTIIIGNHFNKDNHIKLRQYFIKEFVKLTEYNSEIIITLFYKLIVFLNMNMKYEMFGATYDSKKNEWNIKYNNSNFFKIKELSNGND